MVMGSTGEPERKRRHISTISPTAASAAAKRQTFSPRSEDKKLDVAVLRYKNQKLVEQLEAQKFECLSIEKKLTNLKERQKNYDDTLDLVNKTWGQVVADLESLSACLCGPKHIDDDSRYSHSMDDGSSCTMKDEFLSRLLDTGATQSSDYVSPRQPEVGKGMAQFTTKNVLQNIISSYREVWHANVDLTATLVTTLPRDELSRQLYKTANGLKMDIGKFLDEADDLHFKHRAIAEDVQNHRDLNAKHKSEHKQLAEELAATIAELGESNHKVAILRAQKDRTQGTPFAFTTIANKSLSGEKTSDVKKELQDMESSLKELTDLATGRLAEIKKLHEDRTNILKKLAELRQNALMANRSISSSKAFQLLNDQLTKSGEEMHQCRRLLENLQTEKDSFIWREKEMILKTEISDAATSLSKFSECYIAELEQFLQKLANERVIFGKKIEEASREPSRKEVITRFKSLLSSLPKDMAIMQRELSKNKKAALELHSLRAEVQSFSGTLHKEENEIKSLVAKSACQTSENKKLHAKLQDLRQTNKELKLFLEMYMRESVDSRDVIEARDKEYKVWALVHSLKLSLQDHNLESRVKAAIEAEATSQKRLVSAEAEISELRAKLNEYESDVIRLSEVLKSKQEEGEAYLSEIESIGQAYEDMQGQNQHLLQQVIERDDYNIKLGMENVKMKQQIQILDFEIQIMNTKIQQADHLMDLYNLRVAQLDEQLKVWSDQVNKFAEDGLQYSLNLENAKRRFLDVQSESHRKKQMLDGMQTKVEKSCLDVAELSEELEKERFDKKRIEDDLEVMTRKVVSLRVQSKGSTVLDKLRQEVKEYRGILKCSICLDRQKEVVIAKCYHLFCQQCVQRTLENRHRKCPTCSVSFGPNDVKPIYI